MSLPGLALANVNLVELLLRKRVLVELVMCVVAQLDRCQVRAQGLLAVTLTVQCRVRQLGAARLRRHQGRNRRIVSIKLRRSAIDPLLMTVVQIDLRLAALRSQFAALGPPLDNVQLSRVIDERPRRIGLEHDHLVVNVAIVLQDAFL